MTIRITGTGSYIPSLIKKNSDFRGHSFYTIEGNAIDRESLEFLKEGMQKNT